MSAHSSALNFVAGVSLLDRGDAPAQSVLDRNARSLAKRVADETKEELGKVMQRVQNIYGNYEWSTQVFNESRDQDVEYINDMQELEELIKDPIKMTKYKKTVTIFVVGFENVSGQKLRLLQQVNEFFMENASKIDEDDSAAPSPEVELDDMMETIDDTLKRTEQVALRLGDLNREMVNYMYEYAQAKASTKTKKKLEKALSQAKDELAAVNDKLLQLQQETEEKEDRLQQMFKQIELKNMEAQRFKTAAEVAKKSAEEAESLREQCLSKDNTVRELKKDIDRLMLELGMAGVDSKLAAQRIDNATAESSTKLKELQQNLEQQKMTTEDAKRAHEDEVKDAAPTSNTDEMLELQRLHDRQIEDMWTAHRAEVEELKGQHREEIKQLLVEVAAAREEIQKPGSKQGMKPDLSDVAIQDEGGDADTAQVEVTRSPQGHEDHMIMEFEDEFDLRDEQSWEQVPAEHIPGRFLQFRKLTKQKLSELEGSLETTVKKTARKVQTLKAQFHEHKRRWEGERIVLIDQVSQAADLQSAAEKEADLALAQLETFINDQEQLEKEEEEKRVQMDTLTREPSVSVEDAEAQLSKTFADQRVAEAERRAKEAERRAEEAERRAEEAERLAAEREAEAADDKVLLSQTDDAKALSRKTTSGEAAAEAEVRGSSARSRASLREHNKSVLTSLRQSATERRTRSPAIDAHALAATIQAELDSMTLDEDGDMPFPPDFTKAEREMHDMGTSPILFSAEASRLKSETTLALADHPIVQEYLKVYDTINTFKQALAGFFMDKDMTSLSQVLSDIEVVPFDPHARVQPQVEEMTFNIATILEDTLQLVTSALSNDRDYPVSSLLGRLSREHTRSILFTRERSQPWFSVLPSRGGAPTQVQEEDPLPTASPAHLGKYNQLQQLHSELQRKHNQLQERLAEESKRHESQLNHNTVVMMEMQDTIHSLQRELSILGQRAVQPQSARSQTPPIMFTRLDSERNAKMLKRAVNEERLAVDKYQTAVETMDRYVDIPARRMAHLAAKYMHHHQMRQIEDAVRRSTNLDENVFHILDRMESLQNQRAERWAEKMDALGMERLQLANLLMITLDEIERESGIFLIKPMFSYRAPFKSDVPMGKLNRAAPRVPQEGGTKSPRGLAPTPNTRRASAPQPNPPTQRRRNDDPAQGVSGHQTELVGDYTGATWNPSNATPRLPDTAYSQAQVNTPRILELDINRMLIGQNQIAMAIPHSLYSNDRLTNAANLSTRTYATLSRPAGQENRSRATGLGKRTRSASKFSESAPPTTPQRELETPHSAASREGTPGRAGGASPPANQGADSPGTSRTIPATPPLPPITPRAGSKQPHTPQQPDSETAADNSQQEASGQEEGAGKEGTEEQEGVTRTSPPLPPLSPPGSSLRRSPSNMAPPSVTAD